jgi:hypothetical protein
MIRNFFVTFCLLLTCSSSVASDVSPDQFIRQLIDAFNSENLESYQSNFHYPYSRLINGQIEIFTNEKTPALNYSELKKTGWVRSQINELEVLDVGKQSAIVKLNFSRMNSEDQEFLKLNAFYTLTKSKYGWRVISSSIVSSLSVGIENR